MSLFNKIFKWGGNLYIFKTLHSSPHFFHEKQSKEQFDVISEQKTPNGGNFQGFYEERGEEGGKFGSSFIST